MVKAICGRFRCGRGFWQPRKRLPILGGWRSLAFRIFILLVLHAFLKLYMSRTAQLLLLHGVVMILASLCMWSIKGRFNEYTYNARRKMGRLFLPGRLKDKDNWIRQQRSISYVGLLFLAVVYVISLIGILR